MTVDERADAIVSQINDLINKTPVQESGLRWLHLHPLLREHLEAAKTEERRYWQEFIAANF